MKTQVIPTEYLSYFLKKQPLTIEKHLGKLRKLPMDEERLETSIAKAAVYSSMIESNPIDWDKYVNFKLTGIKKEFLLYRETIEISIAKSAFYSSTMEDNTLDLDEFLKDQFPWMKTNTSYLAEIRDLICAYKFATKESLDINTFLKTHEIFSQTLLNKPEYRGLFRKVEVGVYNNRQKIYSATPASQVESEMNKLFSDIEILLNSNLPAVEIFYYASMIHLVFVHIHPFADGNGRAARLLEKWFLAQKIGPVAWIIPSEELYRTRIREYYENINLGPDYERVNYRLSVPFLLLLPTTLTTKFKTNV